MLTLICFLHRADRVELVLLGLALLVQLALLRGELGRERLLRVRLRLGVGRRRGWRYVVRERGRLAVRVVRVGLLVLLLLLLLLLRVVLREVVHVRRGGQADVGLREERVELGGRVLLRVVALLRLMVGRELLLLLLLLPVALAAASAPPRAAGPAASVLCDGYVRAGGLRERALQHVQGGHHRALLDLALLVLMRRRPVVVVSRCHLQSLGLELKLELGGLGLRLRLVFTGAQSATGAFHHSLLLADRVLLLLLGVRVHFMVLLVLRVGIDFMVLLMLMGVHLLVLLMLRVGVHFRVLLMRLVGVHLVVLLVLPVRVHFVVLLMGLQLVAGGVGQHRLEQVRRLAGLVGGGVHEGGGGLRLGMLLLDFRRFPRVWDLRALLRLLLELHLGVGCYLRVRGHVLTMGGVLGGEGVLTVRVATPVVDDRA